MGNKHSKPLTFKFEKTEEGVFVYCPELNLYTDGKDEQEAESHLTTLVVDYYHVLAKHRDSLGPELRKNLTYYEERILPLISRYCQGCVHNPFEQHSLWDKLAFALRWRFSNRKKDQVSWIEPLTTRKSFVH
ncbi:hypothetical protein HKBW3S42_01283 [Candidatus Hakubella thermalkaliphila]|uniref:Uncharacterized protein n=1 Tax=Candidatus Hakubella thermalkaliphila TaxID=2754717 RepID=A0A6V8PJY4_9ACTN|nr:hypothetical protein HKBW3S42_01283 [Candidatus Hakubella thermalkaliphila]